MARILEFFLYPDYSIVDFLPTGTMMRVLYSLFFSIFITAQADTLYNHIPVEFYEAAKHNKLFNSDYAKNNKNWQILKKRYDYVMHAPYNLHDAPRIPKIFHLIWLGSPLPERYHLLVKKLHALHPGWKVCVWTDADVEAFMLNNRRAFDAAGNYGEKSDIWRYEILYRFGGIYLDGDYDVLRSFEPLVHACDFFCTLSYAKPALMTNSIIGAIQGHPVLKRCMEKINMNKSGNDATFYKTGPHHFTRCFFAVLDHSPKRTAVFPATFLAPLPAYARKERDPHKIRSYFKPYSFSVHYWLASWTQKQT